MGGGTFGAVVTIALMVSPEKAVVPVRHNATTDALINPAWRERRLDIGPPLILHCAEPNLFLDGASANGLSPGLRVFGFSSWLGFVIRVFGRLASVRELMLKGDDLPYLLF
jgi:hypothetical protein